MIRQLLFLVFSAFLSLHALAWGKEGRHLVVEVARGLLDDQVKSTIDRYLGTTDWGSASDWLEAVSKQPGGERKKEWRKVLIPRDKTYVPVKTPNLVNQFDYQTMVLSKRMIFPEKDVAEAIRVVFSQVSDAHQPLRCGNTEDQGGKTVPVTVAGKKTDLFTLWDEQLLQLRKCDMWACSKALMNMTDKDRKQVEQLSMTAWVNESRTLLKDVYALDKGVATDTYLDHSADIARTQIVKAGMRLAAVLNQYFKT